MELLFNISPISLEACHLQADLDKNIPIVLNEQNASNAGNSIFRRVLFARIAKVNRS